MPRCGMLSPMLLRLDPWATEYNTAYHADVTHETKTTVDVAAEMSLEDWRPLEPPRPEPHWRDLLFLDGSRRVEARVLLEDEQRQVAFGALGTYGVGVVSCCCEGSRPARFEEPESLWLIERGSARSRRGKLSSSLWSRRFPPVSAPCATRCGPPDERDADAVVRKLQVEMRDAEGRLAATLLESYPDALIICDGPRPFLGDEPNVIGYVKTIHDPRVGPRELEVVRALAQGQRSPLYVVGGEPERAYFEWFFRLRDPNPWLYSLAGMVRLQAYAGPDPAARLAEVQHLADWLCHALPRFASRQHQDPRAPQQLLPVRALEGELGRRMGHAQIVRQADYAAFGKAVGGE